MSDTQRKATKEEKLEVSNVAAVVVNMVKTIDVAVIDEMIAGQSNYHTIQPFIDPTRYRAEQKGMDATWEVLKAIRNLIKVVEENRNHS